MAEATVTAEKRERRELLARWAELRGRAIAAQPESEARQWVEEWTREWRKAGYPIPPIGHEEIRVRADLLSALLGEEARDVD